MQDEAIPAKIFICKLISVSKMLREIDVIFSRSLSGFKLDTYTVQTWSVRFETVSFIHFNVYENKLSPLL